MSNYHPKYRPNELDQVIGQPHAVSGSGALQKNE